MYEGENEKNIDEIDIGTLYQNINAGINFIKSQQWNMAYYSLLMLGAIIGAFELLWNSIDHIYSLQWMRIVFALLAIFASILIWRYSNKLYDIYETDLKKYQGIIDKLSNSDNDNYSYTLHKKVFSKCPEVKDEFYNRPDIGIRNTDYIIWLHRRISLIGAIFSILYFSFKLFTYFILWRFVKMGTNLNISVTIGIIVVVALFVLGLVILINNANFKLKKLEYRAELAKSMINRINDIEKHIRNKEMDGLSIIIDDDLSQNIITFTIKETEKKKNK